MRKEDQRFMGWLLALIMALIFLIMQAVSCTATQSTTSKVNNIKIKGDYNIIHMDTLPAANRDTLVNDVKIPY